MSVSPASQAPVAQTQVASKNETPKSDAVAANKKQPANQDSAPVKAAPPVKDSVTLSSAALLAAQEAAETPAQTAKEAQTGDIQAKHLLAKQAAAKAAMEPKTQEGPVSLQKI